MTLEQQIEAIADRKTVERLAPILRELAELREAVKQNGDQVSTAEAKRLTGLNDHRTLERHLTPTKHTNPLGKVTRVTWSRVEIAEYNARKELTKAAPIAA